MNHLSRIRRMSAIIGALVPATMAAAQVVVPNGLASVEGNGSNTTPFSISPPLRYQQVYRASELRTGVITAVSFRLDGTGGPFGPVTYNGVQLTLSTTTAGPDSLSSTLDDNLGAGTVVVLQGSVSLSSSAVGDPNPFDITLEAQTPFFFDPASGLNLLVELRLGSAPGGLIPSPLDTQFEIGDAVGRAYCQGAVDCATADFAPDSVGLVTGFTYKIFDDGFESGDTCGWSVAVPHGACLDAASGAPCWTDAQCTSGTCLEEASTGLPGGLCTSDCTSGSCATGEQCLEVGTASFCLPECSDENDCREGYGCFDSIGGAPVCWFD